MNKMKGLVEQIKLGLVVGLLTALTGCATFGYGGYYGDTVVVPGPDMYLFGGDYDMGRNVHSYSHRGSESRRVAHPSGGQSHGAAHPNAGKGGKR